MDLAPITAWLASIDGLLLFLVLLVILLFLQRRLHFDIQASLLLITRRPDITVAVFSVIFLPGVFLHEFSHYLMAVILGVPVMGFSLVPKPLPDGRLQMGFVETGKTDWLRDALIGSAPMIAGGFFLSFAALVPLGLVDVWQGSSMDPLLLWDRLLLTQQQADFWLWLYLSVVVSSTMMPSASDRRAWLPVLLMVIGIITMGVLAGLGDLIWSNLGTSFIQLLKSLAWILAFSIVVQIIVWIPVFVLHQLLMRLTGLKVS